MLDLTTPAAGSMEGLEYWLNHMARLLTSSQLRAGPVCPTLSSGEDKIQPCWLEGHMGPLA